MFSSHVRLFLITWNSTDLNGLLICVKVDSVTPSLSYLQAEKSLLLSKFKNKAHNKSMIKENKIIVIQTLE